MWMLLLATACRAPSPSSPAPPNEDPPDTAVGSTGTPQHTGAATAGTATTGRTGDTAIGPIPTDSPYILQDAPPPTNLLLLSVDTMRADRVNSNGYAGSTTTPTLDALLSEGLALRNHRSCSTWTMPSFLCFLTGKDALGLGVWPDLDRGANGVLEPYPNDELPSLAWHLDEQGYATHLVTGNGLIGVDFNMDRGFDGFTRTYQADDTANAGMAELANLANGGDPWFLHIHFMTPHKPYAPDPAFLEGDTACPGHDLTTRDGFHAFREPYQSMTGEDQQACLDHLDHLYDALIRETDHHLARILEALDATGQRDQTAIVFVTDHGESFQEHGFWEHSWGGNVDTLVRSTAGVVYPPRIAPAEHHGLTSHEDALPTLFTLFDLPMPDDLTGAPVGSRDVEAVFQLTYINTDTVQSVATTDGKLIFVWDEGFTYHDLSTDPMELEDAQRTDPLAADALWALLEPKVTELAGRVTSKPKLLP